VHKTTTTNWHKQYLEKLDKKLQRQQRFRDKYTIRSSNNEKLLLPDKPNISRQEILSNPDMIIENNETANFDFIIEVENQINYKKIIGISLLTDIAIRQMNQKYSSELVLITKKNFPNRKTIEREIQKYVRNIKFHLITSDDFSWIANEPRGNIRSRQMETNNTIEDKLMEAKTQLRKNETGNALILLDQALETCLREECLRHGAATKTKNCKKPFAKWSVPNYLKFLGSKSFLTKEQKGYFFKVHEWRNIAQHFDLEPKREQVEEALRKLGPFLRSGLVCAGAIMNKPVIGVELDDPLSKAVAIMEEHCFSQLPVFEEQKSVGSVSEKTLLNFFERYRKPPSPDLQVKEIMDRSFPIIREDTPLTEMLELLRSNHGVLVTKEDHVIGMITKADLLKLI